MSRAINEMKAETGIPGTASRPLFSSERASGMGAVRVASARIHDHVPKSIPLNQLQLFHEAKCITGSTRDIPDALKLADLILKAMKDPVAALREMVAFESPMIAPASILQGFRERRPAA